MSITRYDLNKCIGCQNCVTICPMDVFRFNEEVQKSVIAYPENCQTCGQCYVNCLGHSLALSGEGFGYPLTSVRAATTLPMNTRLHISDTPKSPMIMPGILTVIGAMFAHNAVIWSKKAAERRRTQEPMVVRMSTNQRLQHLIMFVSFILLVITGFTMKAAGAWFAAKGVSLGLIHRVAAVGLIGAGFYHLFYVTLARQGRRLLGDVMPKLKDFSDLWGALRYYLGLSQEKPKFGRFTYAEKAEYWMLAVGTVTMGLTGIMMWAYVKTGNLVGNWWLAFARSWHFYEALLATLAIVVWHFYQIFADPDVAPMNWAWLDGKMPAEQHRRDHELDVEGAQEVQGK